MTYKSVHQSLLEMEQKDRREREARRSKVPDQIEESRKKLISIRWELAKLAFELKAHPAVSKLHEAIALLDEE